MNRGKILVVDDVTKNIQLLGNILGTEGYGVSYATDGRKALAMAKEENYDLILLDIMMPEMDGFEVCRNLKQEKKTKDTPILFLTAKNETKDIVDGLSLGAVDYLTKPINKAELIARVHTHIQLRLSQLIIEKKSRELEVKNRELSNLLSQHKKALSEIKILRGILPICSHCKKIRNDSGYWMQIESYIRDHSEADFTHSICQDCREKHYPYLKKPSV